MPPKLKICKRHQTEIREHRVSSHVSWKRNPFPRLPPPPSPTSHRYSKHLSHVLDTSSILKQLLWCIYRAIRIAHSAAAQSGAKERRVQCRSPAPFLTFSIPVYLRSDVRSKRHAWMSTMHKICTFCVRVPKPFLSSNSQPGFFFKIWKFQPGRYSAPDSTVRHLAPFKNKTASHVSQTNAAPTSYTLLKSIAFSLLRRRVNLWDAPVKLQRSSWWPDYSNHRSNISERLRNGRPAGTGQGHAATSHV